MGRTYFMMWNAVFVNLGYESTAEGGLDVNNIFRTKNKEFELRVHEIC